MRHAIHKLTVMRKVHEREIVQIKKAVEVTSFMVVVAMRRTLFKLSPVVPEPTVVTKIPCMELSYCGK